MPTPAPLQNLNNEVKKSGSPTSPCSVSGQRNQPTKKIQKNSRRIKNDESVTAVEWRSSLLHPQSVWVTWEGHNKICFQPGSLSQLPYPWVWYPPPFPLCSLSLSLFCSVAHTGSLHRYSLTIVKWRNPPTGKTAVKVWLSGGIHPHFTQCRATRVTLCMHTHRACEFPVKAHSEFPSLECELRATHDKYLDILKSPKRTS